MVAMRHLGAAVVLALLPALVAAGQTAPPTEKPKATLHVTSAFAAMRVAEWTTAVRTHAAGTVDEPLRTVASWKREHIALVVRLVVERVHRLLEVRDEGRDFVYTQEVAELTGTLLRGLSLHTDIAIAERNSQAPAGRSGAVILVDGQQTGVLQRSAHWPIARQIAAELSTRPAERPRVIEWYRATAALMQQWGDCDLLGPHLEGGQALFADDPVLALYQGTLRQTMGDPRLHEYVRKRGSAEGYGNAPLASRNGPVPTAASRLPIRTRVELGIAERELRRALTLDPTLHEARVRLAHVLSVLGDHRQAAEVVRPALDAALPPFTEFYAAVILGRSVEQLGRFEEAGAAYARAATRFPGAQSAEIGRSRVELAQGRAADTLKILVDVVGPYSTEQPDPWLDYLKRHDPDAGTLLRAWRTDLK
jgi:tetratricopeptide (TPR) repeat protein